MKILFIGMLILGTMTAHGRPQLERQKDSPLIQMTKKKKKDSMWANSLREKLAPSKSRVLPTVMI